MSLYIDSSSRLHHDLDKNLVVTCPHCQAIAHITVSAVPRFEELQLYRPKQVGIVYQVNDDKIGDSMKLHMPILRNRLLLLLSAKHPSELASSEGKKKLVDELVIAARESLPGTGDKGVTGALLGSFVIQ